MKNIKYFIICVALGVSTLSACSKDNEHAILDSGVSSYYQAIITDFSMISMLYDVYASNLYEDEGDSAISILSEKIDMNSWVVESYNELLDSNILEKDAWVEVNNINNVNFMIIEGAELFIQYIATEEEQDFNSFVTKMVQIEESIDKLFEE